MPSDRCGSIRSSTSCSRWASSRSACEPWRPWVRSFSSRFSITVRSATVNSRSRSSTSRHGSVADGAGRVVEGARHVEQRIGVADLGQHIGVHRPLPRGAGRDGDVDVGDVGVGRLLRHEQRGEAIDPLVRDLHHADVRGGAAAGEAAGLGVAAGQGVEDGRLAAAGQPDDGDLHRLSSRPRGPRGCASARRPGRRAGSRRTGRPCAPRLGRTPSSCAG